MSKLPKSWAAIALSDAVINITITDKKIPQKEYLSEGAYPVFDQGQDYIGGYSDKKEKLVDCELPVIVFGDHTRVIKFVNQPFAPGADGIKVLQPQHFYNPRLLEYFTRHIATHLTNHGYARHYQHLVKSIIPLPPTNEQHRIVAKIEELFSELDKGIENLKTARAQLKVYRQTLLKHAFEGKLTAQWRAERSVTPAKAGVQPLNDMDSRLRGNDKTLETADALLKRIQQERAQRYQQQLADWEAAGKQGSKPKAPKPLLPLTAEELAVLPELPEGWGWVRLASIVTVLSGYAFKSSDFVSAGVPVVKIANVGYSEFVDKDQEFLDSSFLQTHDDFRIAPDDFLLALTRPITNNRTKVCRYPKDASLALLNQRVSAMKDVEINPDFLYSYFGTSLFKESIRSKFSETLQPNLSPKDLEACPIPICALAEQAQIFSEIESRLSEVDQLELTITTSLQQAEALRQSILKKAFSGQLVPQDPHDEPASALLARIRAERATVAKSATVAAKPRKVAEEKA